MEYPDALILLAAIVEQAKKDQWSLTRQPNVDSGCMVEYSHAPRRCARRFLDVLDAKVRAGAPMTTEELAQTVMEVIE